jgi:hypothetical protein
MFGGLSPTGSERRTMSDRADDRGQTCMLADGHDGPHEWTPDDEIVVEFSAADRGKRDA